MTRWSHVFLATIAAVSFAGSATALPAGQSQRFSRGVERLAATGYVSGVPSLRIPSLRMADASESVAPPQAVAASWDGALAYAYGAAVGRLARAGGVDVVGIPLGAYGNDPLLAARLAPGLVRGVQSAHVVAAVVGRGGGPTDARTLRERDLPALMAAVVSGAGAVSCSSRSGSAAAICSDRRLLASILTRDVRFMGFAIGNPYGALATPSRIASTLRRLGALSAKRPPGDSPQVAQLLSQRIVQSGAVLLKNDAAVLPLDPATLSSLALIGADAPTQAALAQALPTTKITSVDAGDLDDAVATAHKAAATLVVLGPQPDATEGQLVAAVAAVNPRTAVILERNPSTAAAWFGEVSALLLTWAPTAGTPVAVANLVSGQTNPCGRLPLALTPLPDGTAPGYGFGRGLSYASFSYSGLRVSYGKAGDAHPVVVHVTVRNGGTVSGTEVAQLYLGAPVGSAGPDKALVGFVRLALRPGQKRELSIPLSARAFATWSPTYKAWYVAPGTYLATVEDGSESAGLTSAIQIVGK